MIKYGALFDHMLDGALRPLLHQHLLEIGAKYASAFAAGLAVTVSLIERARGRRSRHAILALSHSALSLTSFILLLAHFRSLQAWS